MKPSKSWLFFPLLLYPSIASVCDQISSCLECDSRVDDDKKQLCSWCAKSAKCVPVSGLECVFGSRIPKARDCPLSVPSGFEYEDAFARDVMIKLSGAAYSSDPQKCLTNAIKGARLVRQLTVPCDMIAKDTCSGFTAVSDSNKANILSFRGTDGTPQLILESLEAVFRGKVPVLGGGLASRYFFNAFNALWSDGMDSDLLQMKSNHSDYELWITGHSFGGAIASIAANVIAASGMYPGEKIKFMSFGQPRTGDEEFAAAHYKMLPYSYRVIHKHDIVPHLPTENFEGYYHHRYEVWYNNDMDLQDSYNVCLAPEDTSCSVSALDLSTNDHGHYFGSSVSC